MEITYAVIVAVITLICGAITKTFVDTVPDRFIPLQNLIIGIVSAVICLVFKVETDILQAFVLCIIASLGAGGAYDLVMTKIKNDK